jgi:leader peptidase (prepilin peptidase)/N-methyltransferase
MSASYAAIALAALVGSFIGSFLNVCIVRWPAEQSILRPARSKCPSCGHQIAWYENIPVLSWLVLRGKCSKCRSRISVLYPLVELATAVMWGVAMWFLGPTLLFVHVVVFATLMLGIAVTDARSYVIPDQFTLFGLAFLMVFALVGLFTGDVGPFATPWQAVLGACVGAGAIAIAGWLGEVAFKKEAMGFGDATLMAVCGAALGPERALFNVFVAALIGAVVFTLVVAPIGMVRARREKQGFVMPLVPFGVFLAPAAVVTLFYGERWIDWYLGLMGL